MAKWRIKEISDLTKISIRMLRHYDKLGLLKPSTRTENGYRWYSEADLAKLQQIIALKFFGFNLGAIKTMLQQKLGIAQHLRAQQQMLKSQTENLVQAQQALETTLQRLGPSGTPDWNDLISLIERYRMNEELKNTWAGKTLNQEQLALWAELHKQYPKEFALWEKLVQQINENQLGDPEGPGGEKAVTAFMDLAKKTKEAHSKLQNLNVEIFRDIKAGKIFDLPLSSEGNVWLAKATLAYWFKRWNGIYQDIIKHINESPTSATGKKIARSWRNLLSESFSNSSPDFVIGTMMWQEIARQKTELAEQKAAPSAQELVKKLHVPLFFNPEALAWIETALNASQE